MTVRPVVLSPRQHAEAILEADARLAEWEAGGDVYASADERRDDTDTLEIGAPALARLVLDLGDEDAMTRALFECLVRRFGANHSEETEAQARVLARAALRRLDGQATDGADT